MRMCLFLQDFWICRTGDLRPIAKMAVEMALSLRPLSLSVSTVVKSAFYLILLLDIVFVLCAIYTLTLIQPATASTFNYVSLVYGAVIVS
jgi:hypothetical protein